MYPYTEEKASYYFTKVGVLPEVAHELEKCAFFFFIPLQLLTTPMLFFYVLFQECLSC